MYWITQGKNLSVIFLPDIAYSAITLDRKKHYLKYFKSLLVAAFGLLLLAASWTHWRLNFVHACFYNVWWAKGKSAPVFSPPQMSVVVEQTVISLRTPVIRKWKHFVTMGARGRVRNTWWGFVFVWLLKVYYKNRDRRVFFSFIFFCALLHPSIWHKKRTF